MVFLFLGKPGVWKMPFEEAVFRVYGMDVRRDSAEAVSGLAQLLLHRPCGFDEDV
ncbi:hypothetical protein OVY01_21925 [Robbsia sp. Bb-Pol-6]|uniref:Uncharacterized protein n=1 Tax=Robbsia betulipollinis TaxID=2981849 RepID=A0ABT3ZTB2_9BURK|nr:hypothetical protein [Robbsia betulipollinis]